MSISTVIAFPAVETRPGSESPAPTGVRGRVVRFPGPAARSAARRPALPMPAGHPYALSATEIWEALNPRRQPRGL